MLPSLVVEEVRRGVAETLRAQFEPSTELVKDAIGRLIDAPPWVRGPYVQLGLPFVEGEKGRDFFADFQTEFPAHRHQERAWDLCGRQGRSTLVATGTGSGKTECFLYPVLAHVAKARKAGAKGIKAIVIYPMNALADDQAGRIAELVHKAPACVGISYGVDSASCREGGIALGWEDVRDLPAGSIVRKTFPDDTLPVGPVQRSVEYHAPFVRPDREADYRRAWAFCSPTDGAPPSC